MSLESWGTAASIGQVAAINEFRETLDSEKFTRALCYAAEEVPKLITDGAGRSKLGYEFIPPEVEAVRVNQ